MAQTLHFFKFCFILILNSVIVLNCLCCNFINKDMSSLDWVWFVAGPNESMHYEISLCKSLNYSIPSAKECVNSSVCLFNGNDVVNMGDFAPNQSVADKNLVYEGFSLFLSSTSPCGSKGEMRRSAINFACGPDLGVPKLLVHRECEVHFIWRTSVACKNPPKNKEVPCYVIDSGHNVKDLTHLIKPVGGYYVQTGDPSMELIINVCSDIVSDNSTKECPTGSSVCRIKGEEYLSFGIPESRLVLHDDGLLLSYASKKFVAGDCWQKPETKIFFRCPARGKSQPPRLVSNRYCQYEIEWETEYACSESILNGDFKTCQFTAERHGVEIDLSPLRKENDTYQVSGIVDGQNASFILNVCGGLGNVGCNGTSWKSAAVCLNDSSGNSFIIGTTLGTNFKYADNQIFLTYGKRSECPTGMQQETTINFVCDPNAAADGVGSPQHISSEHCIHTFEWKTSYACAKYPNNVCFVRHGKKLYDLQNLQNLDVAWEAVDGRIVDKAHKKSAFYLNVCGSVSKLKYEEGILDCGSLAAACMEVDNHLIDIGHYVKPPVYDEASDSVILTYENGSSCNGSRNWQSSVNFICKPGYTFSEPILVNMNETACLLEFEWHTAEACPVASVTGTDCKVYNPDLGITYDLSPLKSTVYEVENDDYKFYVGICKSVTNSPCSKNSSTSDDIGVCQVEKHSALKALKAGKINSNLTYTNGVVKLNYDAGDPYDTDSHFRETEIIFFCDPDEEKGQLHLASSSFNLLKFHWYTSLVCPPQLVECIIRDPVKNHIYDLSSLSGVKYNWVSFFDEDDNEKKAYINVCRSIFPTKNCDSTSAICVVDIQNYEEKAYRPNVGRSIYKPTVTIDGHVQLNYTHGSPCNAFGENTYYSTIIHLVCSDKVAEEQGPRFLEKNGNCQYTFLWATKAACPIADVFVENQCKLTKPSIGFIFDLAPLKNDKKYYNVATNNHHFQFNICGPVKDGCLNSDNTASENVSVCEADDNGKILSVLGRTDSYILSYVEGQDLALTYFGSNDSTSDNATEVIIRFPCLNTTLEQEPKFIKQENNKYIFELKTSLTCENHYFDCTFVGPKGEEYDLSPLARHDDNWSVRDYHPDHSGYEYYINFCHPLNTVKNYTCPGGNIGACLVDKKFPDREGFNLGFQYSPPSVSENGVVTLHYINGSFCSNGQFRRSIRINMLCTPQQGELTFIDETPECEYIFSMETPVACSLRTSHGDNCKVKDPNFGFIFDLDPLKNTNVSKSVISGEYKYILNVCNPLENLPKTCQSAGICQTKPSDPKFFKSLGQPSSELSYRDGVIVLKYKNGSSNCHGQYNRSTVITFTCDHSATDENLPPTFITEAEDCSYLFEWPTVFACPPFNVTECSVESANGSFYDLSKLSLTNDNYYVRYPASRSQTFVINVCRSVVHSSSSVCPYMSAACLLDSSEKNPLSRSSNLGQVVSKPYIENGVLKMKYSSGDICTSESATTARFMETIIDFVCDKQKMQSEPEYIGRDGCTYYFEWTTAYACPVNEAATSGDCTVEDPLTGSVFNLTSLTKDTPYTIEYKSHKFYLNVCGTLKNTPCDSDGQNKPGLCQEEVTGKKRHWNAGNSNGKLYLNSGALFLNYTDGEPCHQGRFERNTIIQFTCGSDLGSPEFLFESEECTYYFLWKTSLACHSLVHCAINNGSDLIDLSPLSNAGFHLAKSNLYQDKAAYFISLCNPVGSLSGSKCPQGSSVCRIINDVFENLGSVQYPPFIDFQNHATVLYTNGSTCVNNIAEKNKARIIFLCSTSEILGQPVLIEKTDECLHIFEWRTSFVCPSTPTEAPPALSCTYRDAGKGIYFDLTSLKKTSSYYEITEEGKSSVFLLNVCGNVESSKLDKCSGSAVCFQEDQNTVYNYGLLSTQKISYDGKRLRITYFNGDDCPAGDGGKRMAEIFFTCDPNVSVGKPRVYKKYPCLVVFMWETNLVCRNLIQDCAFNLNGNQYDLHLLSSLSHNWNATDDKNNTFWINLCRGIQQNEETYGCPPSAAVCMKNAQGSHMPLGMLYTVNAKESNSSNLLLTYHTDNAEPCASIESVNATKVTTRIFLQCGNAIGSPKFLSGPDTKCYFDFSWETSLACPEVTDELFFEENGILYDVRLKYGMDLRPILNRTFSVPGTSGKDKYIYVINLKKSSQSYTGNSEVENNCGSAAVCQTKPGTSFVRDIGSYNTRRFFLRGSSLHLTLTSSSNSCGKNPNRNVTTLIDMQCSSSAGIGSPEFLYESGGCDYIFQWETNASCPTFRRSDNTDDNGKEPGTVPTNISGTSHQTALTLSLLIIIALVCVAVFILSKAERRAAISYKFRNLFSSVRFPYFRYKRGDMLTELQSDF